MGIEMNKKDNSLRKVLFQSYAKTIIILVLLSFIFTSVYIAKERINRVTELQTNLCDSMQNSLEKSIETMSIVSMNELYSPVLRKELKKVNPINANVSKLEPIYDVISSIIGPYGTVTQVNLHSSENYKIGWGVYELFALENYRKIDHYQEIRQKSGFKYLDEPKHRADLVYYNRHLNSKKFISLYRMYYGPYYEEDGIVEVIQDCDTFFSYLNTIQKENDNLELYVYNENNKLVYPYIDDSSIDPELSKLLISQINPSSDKVITKMVNKEYLISYAVLDDVKWKIVVKKDLSDVLWPIIWFLAIYSIVGILLLGISVFVCYSIAGKVSDPLFRLMEHMKTINLTDIHKSNIKFVDMDYRIDEISMLSNVFQDMYSRLEVSTRDLMAAKIEELRAKMIATQSMINPHFIFNNFANISIMAEENMNEEIVVLCKNLCDYLRYISADSLTTVDVLTEIYYAEKYLECMKVRYGKRLKYSIDIPREMENIMISKLTIQPIIENALKYAFQKEPPWKLKIVGRVSDKGWVITVSDNGVGIKDEYKEEIIENQIRIKRTKDISNMHIGGMGLANVYLRLILLHGEEAQLIFNNIAGGGTEVIIRAYTEK
ncbi:MAG TPA: histidine kinase [Mobilitalea sp.]|nr:histidine kinase [Mobilitalea sp.]